MTARRSRFDAAVHSALSRAHSDRTSKGVDLPGARMSATSRVAAVELPSQRAVDSNSVRAFAHKIIMSKAYTIFIILAVPFSVAAGVIGLFFTNPLDASDSTGLTDLDDRERTFWRFLYFFDLAFIALFLLDVLFRAFAMGMSNYLMDCICWLDMLVSVLDIVGVYAVMHLPAGYSAAAALTPTLRGARILRVTIRSVRIGRLVKEAANLKNKEFVHKVKSFGEVSEVTRRYKDCVETQSINRKHETQHISRPHITHFLRCLFLLQICQPIVDNR